MQEARQPGRQMGVWAATAAVTGEAISLGIFLTPAGMAKSLGSPALLLGVWSGMALVTLAGALCFTELAVRNPHDGGEYLYLRRGFGRHVAFLYGGMAALVMYPGVAAALCVGWFRMRRLSSRCRRAVVSGSARTSRNSEKGYRLTERACRFIRVI